METVSYTMVRNNLAKIMNHVCNGHAPIIITRSKAKPVVMISLEDYNALEEINYLLKSPANAARLIAAIDEIETLIA